MFKHFLVPLDGSPAAEAAIATAVELARLCGATVTVLHMIERHAPAKVHGERHLRDAGDAGGYIENLRACFGNVLAGHVHELAVEDVAAGIVGHIGELGADAVVMSQHGRGGLRSWRLGRLPQQVAARGTIPLFLVKGQSGRSIGHAGRVYQRILIPHDNDPEHARALDVGVALAGTCGAAVHLLRVVPTRSELTGVGAFTGGILPVATRSLLEMEQQEGEGDLRGHANELRQAGIPVTIEVTRGDPAQRIVEASQRREADLIVLGTHALAGSRAFWEGSVGAKICARATSSILLVPVSVMR